MYVLNCLPMTTTVPTPVCLSNVRAQLSPNDYNSPNTSLPVKCMCSIVSQWLQQSQHLSACLMYVLNCLPKTTSVPTPLCLSNVRAQLSPNDYNSTKTSLPVQCTCSIVSQWLQQSQHLSACLMYRLKCLPMTTTVPTPLCLSNVRAQLSFNDYKSANTCLPV